MKSMVNWFQIPCTNFDRAVGFYSTVFDIDMMRDKDPAGNDVAFFFAPSDGISGAINSDPSLTPGADGPRVFLNAEGIMDAVIARIPEAGGEILAPKSEIPQWGSIVTMKDTEGNAVSLHSRS